MTSFNFAFQNNNIVSDNFLCLNFSLLIDDYSHYSQTSNVSLSFPSYNLERTCNNLVKFSTSVVQLTTASPSFVVLLQLVQLVAPLPRKNIFQRMKRVKRNTRIREKCHLLFPGIAFKRRCLGIPLARRSWKRDVAVERMSDDFPRAVLWKQCSFQSFFSVMEGDWRTSTVHAITNLLRPST